jgi:hypothetical protein
VEVPCLFLTHRFICSYVLFTVEFPDDNELSKEALAGLKKFLPGPDMEEDFSMEDDVEIVRLEAADTRTIGKGGIQNHESAYDSDEEEGGGAQAVNCQQS